MSFQIERGEYLTAMTESGMLIIHSLPVTLSWIPRDVVNDAYNVAGSVSVGTFDSLEEAKRAAVEQYSISDALWQVRDRLPFDSVDEPQSENHTPEIDGHNFIRHGIHWKQNRGV